MTATLKHNIYSQGTAGEWPLLDTCADGAVLQQLHLMCCCRFRDFRDQMWCRYAAENTTISPGSQMDDVSYVCVLYISQFSISK